MSLLSVCTEESSSRLVAELDGEILAARVFQLGIGGHHFAVTVEDPAVARGLTGLNASEIHPTIETFGLVLSRSDDHLRTVTLGLERETEELQAVLYVEYAVDDWKQMWTFNEYRSMFAALLAESNPRVTYKQRPGYTGLDLVILALPIESPYEPLSVSEGKLRAIWEDCHRETEDRLSSSVGTESVIALFEFPEEIRIPCEQYLLYFVEFLRNVGVSVTAELQHRANGVLFSVKPSSGPEALDAIRRALEVYLVLPGAQDLEPAVASEIHVQQLISNIQHLHSQLAFASAALQMKDATIEQQQLVISFQKQLLSGRVISSSLRELSGNPTDPEELLGGAVALTTYEGPGFELRLAEIFRKFRKLFKGDSG